MIQVGLPDPDQRGDIAGGVDNRGQRLFRGFMYQFVSVPAVTGDFLDLVFDHALGDPSGEGVVRIPGSEIRTVRAGGAGETAP